MKKTRDVQLEILKRLLATPEHLSVRQLARDLDLPSGHLFYHLKRMVAIGVLIRKSWTDEAGDAVLEYVEYAPQPIFYVENALTYSINDILGKIDDPTPEKIGACIAFMLKLRR